MKIRFLILIIAVLCLLSVGVATGGLSDGVAASGGSISGRVVHDLDGDGDTEDTDEPGLSGWLVVLWKETENGTSNRQETRTDKHGVYRFSDLEDGDYTVSIPCDGQPELWIATFPSSAWVHHGLTVADGEAQVGNDFLLRLLARSPQPTGRISGRLTWDENRNAQLDVSERGAADWSVEIEMQDPPQCFANPETLRATTSTDGSFPLSGLMEGTYIVNTVYPPSGSDTKYVFDYPGFAGSYSWGQAFYFEGLVEVPESGIGNLDIGILDVGGSASISGQFYWDRNQNGTREADEPLVDCQCFFGIMVRTPLGFASFFNPVTTNLDGGTYNYSSLAEGEYVILVSSSSPRTVTIAEGERVTGVDFGLMFAPDEPPATVFPDRLSPTPALATPTPLPTTSTPSVVGPPGTGDGDGSRTTSLALSALLAVCGLVALSTATVWRWRANSHRGGSR